jgi:hypothetical protein
VPAQEWLAQAIPARNRSPWTLASEQPLRLPASGSATLRVAARLGRFAEQLQYTLTQPPEGIAIEKCAADRSGVTLTLRSEQAKPGLKGNLIVQAVNGRAVWGTLPAIRFFVE